MQIFNTKRNHSGLLVVIEASALSSNGGESGVGWLVFMAANDDWARIPNTIPVIIFSLVYHDIIPGKFAN